MCAILVTVLASAQKKHYCAQQQSRDFLLPSFHSTSVSHSYIFTPNVTLIVQNLIYIKEEKKIKQKLNCGLERMHLRAESYATPKLFLSFFLFFKCVESYKTSRVHYVL